MTAYAPSVSGSTVNAVNVLDRSSKPLYLGSEVTSATVVGDEIFVQTKDGKRYLWNPNTGNLKVLN